MIVSRSVFAPAVCVRDGLRNACGFQWDLPGEVPSGGREEESQEFPPDFKLMSLGVASVYWVPSTGRKF